MNYAEALSRGHMVVGSHCFVQPPNELSYHKFPNKRCRKIIPPFRSTILCNPEYYEVGFYKGKVCWASTWRHFNAVCCLGCCYGCSCAVENGASMELCLVTKWMFDVGDNEASSVQSPVLLNWCDAFANLLANGSMAVKWKLHCRWLKGCKCSCY